MKVEWDMMTFCGGETCLLAYFGESFIKSSPVVYIEKLPSTFKASIHSSKFSPEPLTVKKDVSLIELMNWVEEELKFRSSHG